jgi:hypothetical protein
MGTEIPVSFNFSRVAQTDPAGKRAPSKNAFRIPQARRDQLNNLTADPVIHNPNITNSLPTKPGRPYGETVRPDEAFGPLYIQEQHAREQSIRGSKLYELVCLIAAAMRKDVSLLFKHSEDIGMLRSLDVNTGVTPVGAYENTRGAVSGGPSAADISNAAEASRSTPYVQRSREEAQLAIQRLPQNRQLDPNWMAAYPQSGEQPLATGVAECITTGLDELRMVERKRSKSQKGTSDLNSDFTVDRLVEDTVNVKEVRNKFAQICANRYRYPDLYSLTRNVTDLDRQAILGAHKELLKFFETVGYDAKRKTYIIDDPWLTRLYKKNNMNTDDSVADLWQKS